MLDWPLRTWAYRPFAARIWQLRDSVTADDAAYVSVAEFLRMPLVTLDGRLAGASGLRCEGITP
jgi:predicted nucleic acid-binding protein